MTSKVASTLRTSTANAGVPLRSTRAKARGIPNFHIFGEVFVDAVDPGALAWYTHAAGLPAVLDFGFARAAIDAVSGTKGTDQFARLFDGDALYKGGAGAALGLPTFLGNHDMGRFAMGRGEGCAEEGFGEDEVAIRDRGQRPWLSGQELLH